MDLINRFRLSNNAMIALVGSGGKTQLMYQLARDFDSRVILTTTTHLALDQLEEADVHIELLTQEDLPDPAENLSGKIILFTGPQVEENRVRGPEGDLLQKLVDLTRIWDCPLIIESDGARKLPLKAPAEHEPPIPDFVDTVITMVGLAGLGKPLTDEWVHRPEIFSELTGLFPGDTIDSEHLVKLAISSEGGLKNIPPEATRILFINQIDLFPNWKTFHKHLNTLLRNYHMVGFGVLADQMLLEVHYQTAGIVLAGGGSSRFGQTKQLLDWHGITLVSHVASIALDAGLSPVVVVTGADHEEVVNTLKDMPVEIVFNQDWEGGQSTSVREGVGVLPAKTGAAVFLLVDQPLISPELIQALKMKHARSQGPIILPEVEGKPGNPVLFDKNLFQDLKSLVGDQGGRTLFEQYDPLSIAWNDVSSQLDIDTPDDYQDLLNLSN
jgi:molybdenum cofactor cytidylyltransferase